MIQMQLNSNHAHALCHNSQYFNSQWRIFVSLLFALVLTACKPASLATDGQPIPTLTPTAVRCQPLISNLLSLTRDLPIPDNFATWGNRPQPPTRTGSEFDVSSYFSVLDHLKMEQNYVLDYIYLGSGGNGHPLLYARKVDQPAYGTLADYENAEGQITSESAYRFTEHIELDGTADSFFQLVVLRMIGDQFYLQWHANYHDARILCNGNDLDAAVGEVEALFKSIDDTSAKQQLQTLQDFRKQSEAVDLGPIVEFKDNTVIVTVRFFTKWGGLLSAKHIITQSFPHQIIDLQVETLIEYQSGIMY